MTEFNKHGDLVPLKATPINISEQLEELERFKLREQVTSEKLRKQVIVKLNGHGNLS